ncbi:MAG TPA: amino acid permease [candidate division Zixibacteria bacterium]|nr:amino acid permease [candidate division Zixibacteria bacterium]MDD4918258.1 amino acid permease [candidate division Zixibacteria bacterium]MDM7972643.1 amino acid permease [candidate division Zixibacteria bacterium]HOZ06645.1 amino acid permease [candidate division Zixibacteria bacterium]HPI33564.1 amino acid permease [candidate division Zixibacteria bacterium]
MANPLFAKKPLALCLEEMKGENRLRRILGPVRLTSLGVGAIIGTGIFVLVGQVAHDKAGPALMLSFMVAGLACVFAALCYAEFASMVPIAGSAYTYAYATLGELPAWIIGWDLVLEYTVSSATVAHGWSKYFQDFLGIFGLKLPYALSTAPFDYDPGVGHLVSTGAVIDLPAVVVACLITFVLVKGIRESAGFNAALVAVKVAIVLFVIAVGAFFINPDHWRPFAPYGYTGISFFGNLVSGQADAGGAPLGMLSGAAMIFFAYIGFDSVSTHAEEAKRPNRDVPIGIIASLIICTVLYLAVAAVLTGMVPYDRINIEAPVSDAFRQIGLPWAQFLISLGAVAGITSVLLVMMLSQPRVMLAMARDGMVPPSFFGAVHPKFRTPWKSTILTGIFVSVMAAALPLRILAELVNIGTLLAFVIVCAAVLIMRYTNPHAERPFRAPLFPLVPLLGIGSCVLLMFSLPVENWLRLFGWLAVGFVIYFTYSRRHAVTRRLRAAGAAPERKEAGTR